MENGVKRKARRQKELNSVIKKNSGMIGASSEVNIMSNLTVGPLSPLSPLSPVGPGTPCEIETKTY